MFIMGMTGVFSQFFYILAIKRETAQRVSALNLLGVVFGFLIDYLIFSYEFKPLELVGLALIIICSAFVFIFKPIKKTI